MATFFKRLLQLIDNKGFKNLNDFALKGLKYDSSSKLARLKDENKKPSVEIVEDIANKFEDLDLRWLLLGTGEMLTRATDSYQNNETSPDQFTKPVNNLVVELLKDQVSELKKDKEDLKKDKALLTSLIETKLGNQEAS